VAEGVKKNSRGDILWEPVWRYCYLSQNKSKGRRKIVVLIYRDLRKRKA